MILPGATLGVLGGGQLGRMFTAEAQRMGYRVLVVDPDPHSPAGQLADFHLARRWSDPQVLTDAAEQCDAITIEFENIPAESLRALAAHTVVHPSASAISVTQNRVDEKRFLNSIGVATVEWAAIAGATDFDRAWTTIGGATGLLKTARMGYDGKGQVAIDSRDAVDAAFAQLGEVPCILERRIALDTEISVMVARGGDDTVVSWPIAENVHRHGILHTSVVPARVADRIAAAARGCAERIVSALDYVGVMGVECFVDDQGHLLVNELAPRPHNSGHWTLDAAVTSQFEQQVRALTGLPLGDITAISPVAMVNLLGDLWIDGEPEWARALAVPGIRLHLYGKREARPGRKMGHLTALAPKPAQALERALEAWTVLNRGSR